LSTQLIARVPGGALTFLSQATSHFLAIVPRSGVEQQDKQLTTTTLETCSYDQDSDPMEHVLCHPTSQPVSPLQDKTGGCHERLFLVGHVTFRRVKQIQEEVAKLKAQGIPPSKVVLGGFLQGRAVALLAARRNIMVKKPLQDAQSDNDGQTV
jgi:hypothetical protein